MPDMMQKDRIQKSVILDEQFKFEFQLYRKFPISIKSVVYTSCTVGKVSSVDKASDLRSRGPGSSPAGVTVETLEFLQPEFFLYHIRNS